MPATPWLLLRRQRTQQNPAPLGGGPYRGVSTAGGSFGDHLNMSTGVYGTNWFYEVDGENRTNTAGFTFLRSQSCRTIRIDFRWERMQPTLGAALDSDEVGRLHAMLQACTDTDLYAILDCHNYGHRKTTETGSQGGLTIGDVAGGGPSIGQWQDFWDRFTDEFKDEPRLLGYEVMNEPVSMTGGAAQSHTNDQAAVDAIRANDKRRYIFVDGYNWAAVGGWRTFNPSGWINDSGRTDSVGHPLLRYTGHHYFDPVDASYDTRVTPQPGDDARVVNELADWCDWLEDQPEAQGFGAITECGWPDTDEWNQVGDFWMELADQRNIDVWIWAAGAAWSPAYKLRAFGAGDAWAGGSSLDNQSWHGTNGDGSNGDQIDVTHGQGQVLLRTWNPPVVPPPPGGLAMPRGPTGSRWGPDAAGPDGGYPGGADHMDYNSAAGKAFTAFACCCDFYDSIGVIGKASDAAGIGYDTVAHMNATLQLIADLGVRHFRGTDPFTPANKESNLQWRSQRWFELTRLFNAGRDTGSGGPGGDGEQPIYNLMGISAEKRTLIENYEAQYGYTLFDVDATEALGQGLSYLRLFDGPPGVVSTTVPTDRTWGYGWTHPERIGHWAGAYHSRESSLTGNTPTGGQTPIGWDTAAAFHGPNEPSVSGIQQFNRNYGEPYPGQPQNHGIRWIAKQFKKLQQDPSRQNDELFAGEEYVDYNTGRIATGAKFSQLPICPTAHPAAADMTAADANTENTTKKMGDYTTRTEADFCAWHQYWGGEQPRVYYLFGTRAQQATGVYGSDMHARNAYNGSLNPASGVAAAPSGGSPYRRYWRSIPMWCTEFGYVNWGVGAASNQQSHPGCPPDVYAEYILRMWIQQYLLGVKRNYVYSLSNHGGDNSQGDSFGLCKFSMAPRAPYYAIQNMLGLVKFADPATVDPISVPHTWTAGTSTTNNPHALYLPSFTSDNQPDTLLKLVLQQSDDTYMIVLVRTRQLYDRASPYTPGDTAHGNAFGHSTGIGKRRVVADPLVTSLTLPSGDTWTCSIAEPAKNPATVETTQNTTDPNVGTTADLRRTDAPGTPNDGVQYLNIDDGQALEPPVGTTTGTAGSAPFFSKNGNVLHVQMAGLTRVIKAVRS